MLPTNSYTFDLRAPHDLRLDSRPIEAKPLEPDELICQTLYSAISPGTELAAYCGLPPLRPTPSPYPRLLGYMNVAKVIVAGEKASRSFPPGSVVYSHAAHGSVARLTEDRVLAIVPEGLEPRLAAPAYLFRLGWNALKRAAPLPGQDVAVIGLGAIGLATVQMTIVSEAACTAISAFESARSVAQGMGAHVLTRSEARSRCLSEISAGGGLSDVTITTSNSWDDWQLALSMTRFNGTICVLGFPGRGLPPPDENPLQSRFFYDRQLTVKAAGFGPIQAGCKDQGSDGLKEEMREILRWLDSGALDSNSLIAQTLSAAGGREIYERLINDRFAPGTIVLDWTEFASRS